MIIRKRLKTIADLVESDTVIDVGCDHALLDIYLVKEKNIKAIASDCNKNALEIAKSNVKKYNLRDKIELYLKNGTEDLPLKKDATLVIAGMGTRTIIDILEHTKVYPDQIILQSNNDLDILRKYIVTKGYFIEKEKVVIEGKIYNVIMSLKKGPSNYCDIDYKIGPQIRKKQDKNHILYIEFLLKTEEAILKKIPKDKKDIIQDKINFISELKNILK